MLTRIGRATFDYALKEQPALLAVADMVLEALPMVAWMKLVMGNVTSAANKSVNRPSHLDEEAAAYYFGVLQEAVVWASNKNLTLTEVACVSNGASACVPHPKESLLSRIDQRVRGLWIREYDGK